MEVKELGKKYLEGCQNEPQGVKIGRAFPASKNVLIIILLSGWVWLDCGFWGSSSCLLAVTQSEPPHPFSWHSEALRERSLKVQETGPFHQRADETSECWDTNWTEIWPNTLLITVAISKTWACPIRMASVHMGFMKLNRRIKTLLSLNIFLDFIFLTIVVNIIEYNLHLKFPMNGIQLDVDVGTI